MTPTSEYREILLTKSKVAFVDADDYDWLNQWKWTAIVSGTGHYTARRKVEVNKKVTVILMHRLIVGLNVGDTLTVDHINHNPLDNRRSNLRIATTQQQCWNTRRRKDNTSGFKGIRFNKTSERWLVRISKHGDGRSSHIGSYASLDDARRRYAEVAAQLHGDFACHEEVP